MPLTGKNMFNCLRIPIPSELGITVHSPKRMAAEPEGAPCCPLRRAFGTAAREDAELTSQWAASPGCNIA